MNSWHAYQNKAMIYSMETQDDKTKAAICLIYSQQMIFWLGATKLNAQHVPSCTWAREINCGNVKKISGEEYVLKAIGILKKLILDTHAC